MAERYLYQRPRRQPKWRLTGTQAVRVALVVEAMYRRIAIENVKLGLLNAARHRRIDIDRYMIKYITGTDERSCHAAGRHRRLLAFTV